MTTVSELRRMAARQGGTMNKLVEMKDLLGLTLSEVKVDKEEIFLKTRCGRTFRFYHEQDCCECVSVEDVIGDTADLIGEPLLLSEKSCYSGEAGDWESFTWTFYRLATRKGHVDIRWHGTSNGYYSESVSLAEVTE